MFWSILFKLIIAHAITDFALQTQFIAETKSRRRVPSYLDELHLPMWPYTLTAHALINAAGVYLVTNSLPLALLETVVHWLIDFDKCEGNINLHTDQWLHLVSKIFLAVIVYLLFMFRKAVP